MKVLIKCTKRTKQSWVVVLLIVSLICPSWPAVLGIGYVQALAGEHETATPGNGTRESDRAPSSETGTAQKSETIVIATFSNIEDAVCYQNYAPGDLGAEEDPVLPEKLDGYDNSGKLIAIPVPEWEICDGMIFNPDAAGIYIYQPVLSDGYELGDEAELPVITATIESMADADEKEAYSVEDLMRFIEIFNETDSDMVINIMEDIAIYETIEIWGGNDNTLTLCGGKRLYLENDSINMLNISGDCNVILENIVLDGNKDNIDNSLSLIKVSEGTLTIGEGSVLYNNDVSSNYGVRARGGAISVNGGKVIMNGGIISGNTALRGGGIYSNGGSIEISGGMISENTASEGSGIFLDSDILINGGLIFGQDPMDKLIYPTDLFVSDNGFIIAWDKQENTIYYENTDEEIITKSEAGSDVLCYWSNQDGENGIAYSCDGNEGFIPLQVLFDVLPVGTFTEYDLSGDIYNGSAQGVGTPVSTIFPHVTVKYNDQEEVPISAGNYEVSVLASMGAGYPATEVSLGSYQIDKKEIYHRSASLAEKIYDGTSDAEIDIVLEGFADGENLIKGEDYFVTAQFDSTEVSDASQVNYKIHLTDSDKAKNYSISDLSHSINGTIIPVQLTGSVVIAESTIKADETVSADTSGVLPADATYTYQWMLDDIAVSGAVGETWQVSSDAAGKAVTVSVTGCDNYTGSLTSFAVTVSTPDPEDPDPEDPDPGKQGSGDSDFSDSSSSTGFWTAETDGNWRYYTSAKHYASNTWIQLTDNGKTGWYRFDDK